MVVGGRGWGQLDQEMNPNQVKMKNVEYFLSSSGKLYKRTLRKKIIFFPCGWLQTTLAKSHPTSPAEEI